MRRFVIPAVAFTLLAAAGAIAYPPATLTQTDSEITVGGLDCGTQYEIRVREWRSGAWRDTNTYYPTTTACPTPTPTPSATPTATPVPAPVANFSINPNPAVRTQTTTFTSTGTCDADPCEYHWFHGDANSTEEIDTLAVQPNLDATFVYVGPVGTRQITLKVTDSLDRTSSKTITFDLVEPSVVPTPTPTPPPTGFPDSTNTGVPGGITLTPTGAINATTNGQVIDGMNVNGNITVSAPNVTIRNTIVHGEIGNYASGSATGLLVQDSEVNCGVGGTGIWSHDMTVLRTEISNCENGMHIDDNVTVRDSYIHALAGSGAPHIDGIQGVFGPGVVIDHNTIIAYNTSTVNIYNENPPQAHDVWVTNNRLLMTDDHLSVYCPRYDIGTPNIYVNNNRIDDTNHAGLTDSCRPGSTITEFNGNVVDSTGAPIAPN